MSAIGPRIIIARTDSGHAPGRFISVFGFSAPFLLYSIVFPGIGHKSHALGLTPRVWA